MRTQISRNLLVEGRTQNGLKLPDVCDSARSANSPFKTSIACVQRVRIYCSIHFSHPEEISPDLM